MSNAAKVISITARSEKVSDEARSLYEEKHQHLLYLLDNLSWRLALDAIRDAIGAPCETGMESHDPLPADSIVSGLGHKNIPSFITAERSEYGLGLTLARWQLLNKADRAARSFVLKGEPEEIVTQIESATGALGRPPVDAAELQQALGAVQVELVKDRYEAQIEALALDHQRELERYEQAHCTAVSALEERLAVHQVAQAEELKDLNSRHQDALTALKEEHQKAAASLKAQLADNVSAHAQALETLKQAHRQEMGRLDDEHKAGLDRLQARLTETEARHRVALEDLNHQRLAELKRAAADYRAALSELEAKLTDNEATHKAALESIQQDHRAAITEMESTHQEAIQGLNLRLAIRDVEHQSALEALKESFDAERQALSARLHTVSSHMSSLARARQAMDEQIESLTQVLGNQELIATLDSAEEARLRQALEESRRTETELAAKIGEQETQVLELTRKLTGYESAFAELSGEKTALEVQLAESLARLDALQSEQAQKNEKVDEITSGFISLQAQHEELLTQHAELKQAHTRLVQQVKLLGKQKEALREHLQKHRDANQRLSKSRAQHISKAAQLNNQLKRNTRLAAMGALLALATAALYLSASLIG